MTHRILDPHPDLRPFVKCYWTLEIPSSKAPARNTIVPDGCIKLIFHHADPYRHLPTDGPPIQLPSCFVVGQLTQPYAVEPMGKTATFFVCFHPNGFLPFTSLPIREMENKAIPLSTVFGPAGNQLGQDILNAASTENRIAKAEAFLFARLSEKKTIDRIVDSTVASILTANGKQSVSELSNHHAVSRRQLARKFSTTIGLSPKQLSKTIRLQAALKLLLAKDHNKLTELAYQNEYYDQAHFIREFKEFTGLTPKEFYGNELKMSLIFDGADFPQQ
ncbi:AraC family transcriptional regulator [Lewinellaceae bacterium SD302]|nr:AraC family transcriptional regulator [Lewinellaceae bacterium SD302]